MKTCHTGKKLSGFMLLACALSLPPASVFGGLREELLVIAKEAWEKGIWKPKSDVSEPNDPNTQRERFLKAFDEYYPAWIDYYDYAWWRTDPKTVLNDFWKCFSETLKVVKKDPVLLRLPSEALNRAKDGIEYDIIWILSQPKSKTRPHLHKLNGSDRERLGAFFREKAQSFIGKEKLDFAGIIDKAKREGNALWNCIRNTQSELSRPSVPPERLVSLSEELEEKKNALLQALQVPYPGTQIPVAEVCDAKPLLEEIHVPLFVKNLELLQQKITDLSRYEPKDGSQMPNDFGIPGLDRTQLKYRNPFNDPQFEEEEVKPYVKKAVNEYTAKFPDAYFRAGNWIEGRLLRGLTAVNEELECIWASKTADCNAEFIINLFNAAIFAVPVEKAITEVTPKIDTLKSALDALRITDGIDAGGVEKKIFDAYGIRFGNTVTEHYRQIVTALQNLVSHDLRFVEIFRQWESEQRSDMPEEMKEQVERWRTQHDDYEDILAVIEGDFYETFFGDEETRRFAVSCLKSYQNTAGFVVFRERLTEYGFLKEKQSDNKAFSNPNTIIEDKKTEKTDVFQNSIKEEDEKEEPTSDPNTIDTSSRPTRTRRGGSSNNNA